MGNVLNKEVGKDITLLDGFFIGGAKIASEQVMQLVPFVGNTSLRSGAIKAGTALALSTMVGNKSKLGYLYSGILIDGMEDIVLAGKRMIMGGQTAQSRSGEVSAFGR